MPHVVTVISGGSGDEFIGNNLSDLTNESLARTNLGLSKGPDITSGSTITPTLNFEFYHVTGTVTINYINYSNEEDGKVIELYFVSALTLTNNAGTVPVNTYALQLLGASDASMGAGSKIKFRRDTALTKWIEISRSPA